MQALLQCHEAFRNFRSCSFYLHICQVFIYLNIDIDDGMVYYIYNGTIDYKGVNHVMDYEILSWLIAFVVFLIVEAVTFGLASIFFAFGAFVALIAGLIGAPLWLQIVLFLIVSAVTLYFTRPLAKKYINARRMPTNADRMLNMIGIVTEVIDNIEGTGAVSVGGKIWTARSLTGENIPKDAKVRAQAIEGVKLIVVPLYEAHAEDREQVSQST